MIRPGPFKLERYFAEHVVVASRAVEKLARKSPLGSADVKRAEA